ASGVTRINEDLHGVLVLAVVANRALAQSALFRRERWSARSGAARRSLGAIEGGLHEGNSYTAYRREKATGNFVGQEKSSGLTDCHPDDKGRGPQVSGGVWFPPGSA